MPCAVICACYTAGNRETRHCTPPSDLNDISLQRIVLVGLNARIGDALEAHEAQHSQRRLLHAYHLLDHLPRGRGWIQERQRRTTRASPPQGIATGTCDRRNKERTLYYCLYDHRTRCRMAKQKHVLSRIPRACDWCSDREERLRLVFDPARRRPLTTKNGGGARRD